MLPMVILQRTIEKRDDGNSIPKKHLRASSVKVLNDCNNKQLSYTERKERGMIEKKMTKTES